MPQSAPAPPQIPAGWKPVPADFTAWVTNPFSFLSQPAVFRAHRAAAQAITGGSYNILNLDTVDEDPYGGWNSGTHAWTCPAGCAGWYDATLSGFTASQGAGTGNQNVAVIALNGALWEVGPDDWAPASAPGGGNGSVQVPLIPGDTVQMWVFATASVSTPVTAGQLPSIELAWVSS
jgi:hypothetical protein